MVTLGGNTEELLEGLTIAEQPRRRPPPPPPVHSKVTSPGPENVRPHVKDVAPQSINGNPTKESWNVIANSCDKSPRRLHNTSPKRVQRRNSETSVRESLKRPGASDHRRRHGRKEKPRPSKQLDIIDQLDVTSIFGTGLFHHDGPFDACNPHRNQKGSRSAPIQAFPEGSGNMALGGMGPNNSNIDLALFNGVSAQGYTDYSASGGRRTGSRSASFNLSTKEELLHGDESMGLGTSTFLEGARASRTAIQRRQSDNECEPNGGGGGLGRKMSKAMKIRAISNKPMSPELAEYSRTPTSPPGTSQTLPDRNPFFEEYERKGAQIVDAGEQAGLAKRPSSPRWAPNPKPLSLERKLTAESVGEGSKSGAGGFLSRVRSLKGGPRR